MSALDLNRLLKEENLLKVTAEILEGSDSNVSILGYNAMLQVEEMKEGLQALKILVAKHKEQTEICKVW
jgi:transcriptional regulator